MFRLFNARAHFREIMLAAAVFHATTGLDVNQRFPR